MFSAYFVLIFTVFSSNILPRCEANVLDRVTSRKYFFMDNSATQCGTSIEAISGIIYSHAEKALPVSQGNYDDNVDCTITLAASNNTHNYRFVPGYNGNAINLLDNDDCLGFSIPGEVSSDHCGTGGDAITINDFSVESSEVEVSLQTGSSSAAGGFEIYFFTYGAEVNSACEGTDFHCAADSFCIPDVLRCNGIPECADGADEAENHCNALLQFFFGLDLWQVAVILSAIALIVVVATFLFICCCVKKCCRKRRRIRNVKRITVKPVMF